MANISAKQIEEALAYRIDFKVPEKYHEDQRRDLRNAIPLSGDEYTNYMLSRKLKGSKSALQMTEIGASIYARSKNVVSGFASVFPEELADQVARVMPLDEGAYTSDFDQKGFFSQPGCTNMTGYTDKLKQVLVAHFKSTLLDKGSIKASQLLLPAENNMAWPLITKLSEVDGQAYLAYLGCVAHGVESGRYSMEEFMSKARLDFGTPYSVAFSRLQPKGKELYAKLDNGLVVVQRRCAPDFRGVIATSKVFHAVLRKYTKLFTKSVLENPHHNPRSPYADEWVRSRRAAGYTVFAMDSSKFDKNHGGRRLPFYNQVFEEVVNIPASLKGVSDMEDRIPHQMYHDKSCYLHVDPDTTALASGSARTTIINLIGSATIFFNYGLTLGRSVGVGKDIDFLNWGDDAMVAVKNKNWQQELIDFCNSNGYPADVEERLAFLGRYEETPGSGVMVYSAVNMTQKVFFPESKNKSFWSTRLGICSRTKLLGGRFEPWFLCLQKRWDVEKFGEPFSSKDIPAVAAEAARKCSNADIRGAVYSFFSGMELDDVLGSYDGGGDGLVDAILEAYGDGASDLAGFAFMGDNALDSVKPEMRTAFEMALKEPTTTPIRVLANANGLRGGRSCPYF
jgi:hypothetical protein